MKISYQNVEKEVEVLMKEVNKMKIRFINYSELERHWNDIKIDRDNL